MASESLYAMIDHLAWPLAVMVVAVCFRDKLGPVFGRLASLKYRGIEVKFLGQQLDAAEALAGSDPASPQARSNRAEPADPLRGRLERLARVSPSAAIQAAWWELDGASGPADPSRDALHDHLRAIAEAVQAARIPAPTLDQALRFIALVLALLGRLRDLPT